jgi:hypothetical protein
MLLATDATREEMLNRLNTLPSSQGLKGNMSHNEHAV